MEKAILKTLVYASIFDYPLKAHEVLKWLILKQGSLRQVERGLNKLIGKKHVEKYKDYYFLRGSKSQVLKRIKRIQVSKWLMFKARVLSRVLKLIPWVKLVGVSGGLAMENSTKKDDIDLFIITAKDRLWLSRLFAILIFTLLTARRGRKTKKVSGKFCLNAFIREDNLKQERKDIYTAHEVLQMKVIWERGGMYSRFLAENEWVFKFLPNWTIGKSQKSKIKNQKYNSKFKIIDILETIAKWLQLKYMGQPKGMERIEDGALYFHPQDYRNTVLTEYKERRPF